MSRLIQYGWYGYCTSDGTAIETSSGKRFKDLPMDYMVSVNTPIKGRGDTPFKANCIFICGGVETEHILFCTHSFWNSIRADYPIDPWR